MLSPFLFPKGEEWDIMGERREEAVMRKALIASLFLLLGLAACSKSGGPEGKPLGAEPAPSFDLAMTTLSTPDFTMEIPEGWTYKANPGNLGFGLVIYDPQVPERRIFYYYEFSPFMKSQGAKDFFRKNYGAGSLFASCPVLEKGSVEEFYSKWNEYGDFLGAQGYPGLLDRFQNLEVVEAQPLDNYLKDYALDSAVLRTLFTLEGSSLPLEGLFSASVVSNMSYYQGGLDMAPLTVYNAMGIMAPAHEFPALREVLEASLRTFSFTEAYVRSYVASNEAATQAILENARTMAAAADSYNRAWEGRQKVNDALSQKRSDATLGYDRLYDEETGEIYRAPVGWYDQYDIHREEYERPQLYKVEEDDYQRYSQGIQKYIQ